MTIQLARPCGQVFGDMRPIGESGGRFCDACATPVHDLAALTEREAHALVAERGASICVRTLHDPAGRPVFRDTRVPTGATVVPLGRLTARLAAVAAVLAAPLLLEACGGAPRRWDYHEHIEAQRPSERSDVAEHEVAEEVESGSRADEE